MKTITQKAKNFKEKWSDPSVRASRFPLSNLEQSERESRFGFDPLGMCPKTRRLPHAHGPRGLEFVGALGPDPLAGAEADLDARLGNAHGLGTPAHQAHL